MGWARNGAARAAIAVGVGMSAGLLACSGEPKAGESTAAKAGTRASAGGETRATRTGAGEPGRPTAERGRTRRPPPPRTLLPPKSVAVVRIDVQQLRDSRHAARMGKWLMGNAEMSEAERAMIDEVIERTDRVLVGVTTEDGRTARFVAVLRGEYERGQLMTWAKEQGDDVEVRERDGVAIASSSGMSGVELGPRTWVLLSKAHLEATLQRAGGKADGGPLASGRLAAMAERIDLDADPIGAVVELIEPLRRRLLRRGLPKPAAEVRTVGAHLDLDDGIRGRLVADTEDRESAKMLGRYARRMQQQLGSNVLVRLTGFGSLFDAVRVEVQDTAGVLHLDLPPRDTDELLSRFEELGQALGAFEVHHRGGGAIQMSTGDGSESGDTP